MTAEFVDDRTTRAGSANLAGSAYARAYDDVKSHESRGLSLTVV